MPVNHTGEVEGPWGSGQPGSLIGKLHPVRDAVSKTKAGSAWEAAPKADL